MVLLVNPQAADTLCASLLGESSPPKAAEMWPWTCSCFLETMLPHSWKGWESPAMPGSSTITWDIIANLAYSSQQGCVLDCRWAHGRNTRSFSRELPMEVCLSQQLHILDRNSCASATNYPCSKITKMNAALNKKQSWVKANTLAHKQVKAKCQICTSPRTVTFSAFWFGKYQVSCFRLKT